MAESDEETAPPLHLAVIGGGLAGFAAADWASGQGVDVTIFNAGLPIGGSCIHVETFPARLLMTAARDHSRAHSPRFDGLNTAADAADWASLNASRQRKSDQIGRSLHSVLSDRPNIEIVDKRACFIDEKTIQAGERKFQPDRVLLTPGSHSIWPDIDGLDEVSPLTIKTLGELDELPADIVFLEFSDVALAFAQVLGRLGTKVTILTHRNRLFEGRHSSEIANMMQEILADDGVDLVCNASITHTERQGERIRLMGTADGHPKHWDTEAFVIINHRQPQIEGLGLEEAKIELTDEGLIVTNESLQTTNESVFAAGDAIGRGKQANAAAYDAVLAARNAISPSRTAGHNTAVPFTIYTDPQLAGVGWDEQRAAQAGFDVDVAVCPFEDLPAAQSMGYDRGFVKLIRDARSDHLLGGRILGPHASEMIMELALAVRYGLTTSELAALVHPPISLGEAISRAARSFQSRRPTTPERPPNRINP